MCVCVCVCYQLFVVDLLSDEFVFAQRVASLSSDGVDGPFLHLLLYGTVQHEERLACTLLTDRQTDRQTGRETESRHYHSLILKTHQQQQDLTNPLHFL